MTRPILRTFLCVAVILFIAPLITVTVLVCHHPERWGGSINPLNILIMSVFGLLTVKLWPTYIPAVVITPLFMRWLANKSAFISSPLPLILGSALLVGAIAGVGVLSYVVLISLKDSTELAFSWALAGAISGGLTLTIICLIYRYVPGYSPATAAANATPPPLKFL
jgi:hypothetical protein